MSTDRGTIISPHISPTLSIDTDSKKPVINLVQNFPKARALPAPRPACVLWKWLSKSVIVNCVIACTALYCGLYWHDWRLESDQCKSSQNGSSAPNWCFQIIITKEWDFSSSAPTHSMVSAAFCCLARHSGGRSQTMMEFCTPVSGQFKILNRILFV